LKIGEGECPIQARVKHVEPTGADTSVFADIGGAQICSVSSERRRLTSGAPIGLMPNLGSVHLFDAASGQALS
jgi:multiple sugar transport system ATP-binding protein